MDLCIWAYHEGGGSYKQSDLLEPLNIINSYIRKVNAKTVLELGAGNGSNSAYLAQANPTIKFMSLDLSKKPLNKFNSITNFEQQLGDYHDLNVYKDESIDLIFAIETICHSQRKDKVLGEAYRKLKKGGFLIIFDGYINKEQVKLTEDEKLAKELVEKTMAVDSFDNVKDFEKIISGSNFALLEKEDLTQYVLPSMRRFEKLALRFYKYPLLTMFFKTILPEDLSKNSIAGLLMPMLMEQGIGCYYLHVLKKN